MGNFLYTQYNEVCDTNMDYDEKMTDKETKSGIKNIYYWFGFNENDLEMYELMESDD